MAYVTLDEFRAYLGSEHIDDDDQLALCLAVAERGVDRIACRSFSAVVDDATATTRTYVPLNAEVVYIDDLADTAGLTIDNYGSAIAVGAIQLDPINLLGTDRRARPIEGLRLFDSCWYRDGQRATVSITSARWGWLAVPDAAKQATLVAAKDLFQLRDARFGTAGFGEFGVLRIRENPTVRQILDGYVRFDRAVGLA